MDFARYRTLRPFGATLESRSSLAWACRIAAFVVPFAGYLLTLAPSVQLGDSAELSTAVATLGVPHSPGYPVYVLATYPFTLLPVGDVGLRVNLASAVYGALCALMIYELLVDLDTAELPALIASQLAAFSYSFWAQSVIAEVYTFDALLLMVLLRALVGFRRRHTTRWLALVGAVAGLGIADRSGFALYLPLVVALLVARTARPTLRQCAIAMACFAAGLSVYLFVPIRSTDPSAYIWGGHYALDGTLIRPDLRSVHSLWNYFTLRPFRWLFLIESRSAYAHGVWTLGTWAWAVLLGGGVVLAMIGLARAWRERRIEILAAGAMAAVYGLAIALYAAPDRNTMILPLIALFVLPAGVGLASIWSASAVLRASAACSVAILVFVNFTLVNQSRSGAPRADAVRTLRAMDRNAIVMGYWPQTSVLEYLQRVEHQRPDVRVVQIWATGLVGAKSIIDANRPTRPIYVQTLGDGPPPPGATRATIPGWIVFEPPGVTEGGNN